MKGNDRHNGEDDRAVNQLVVYLTTAEDEIFRGKGVESVATYKYVVEIPEDDPDLFLDEKDFVFRQEYNEALGETDTTKWYFFKRSTKVQETLEWDGRKYVKRNNF